MEYSTGSLKTMCEKRLNNHCSRVIRFIDSIRNDRSCDIFLKQLLSSTDIIRANIIRQRSPGSEEDFIASSVRIIEAVKNNLSLLVLLRGISASYNKELMCIVEEAKKMDVLLTGDRDWDFTA